MAQECCLLLKQVPLSMVEGKAILANGSEHLTNAGQGPLKACGMGEEFIEMHNASRSRDIGEDLLHQLKGTVTLQRAK
ncbi:unnamed protein product [Lota lota]